MPIDCEVVPRPGATRAELKALGSALLGWYVRECRADGLAHSVDTEALVELLNGRLPTARVPRPAPSYVPSPLDGAPALNGYVMPTPTVEQLRQALPAARRPAALLRVRQAIYDRARTVHSLREHLPAGLVAEVLVEGRSWDVM